MSTFWWVRHGPTHERRLTGWRDMPADLSDHAALARLSACLPARAALISSDLARARATADALAAPGRQRLPDAPALREFDFGEWDGLGFDEVSARDPDLSRAFWERPGAVAAPGGDSWNALEARVSAEVARLEGQHADVIIVAHFGTILTQLAKALGIAPAEVLAHPIDPLSVTRIEQLDQGWRVHEINHLP